MLRTYSSGFSGSSAESHGDKSDMSREMSVSWSTLPFGYICIQHLVDERHEEASQFSRYFDILMT